VTEQFITQSPQVQKIIKGFNLTKTLLVSSIIIGEKHTGKRSLIKHLFPTATVVDGNDQEKVENFLENQDELIILNFEKLSNIENLNFDNKRIIAIANYMSNERIIDNLFAFIYHMPSLKERPEDIELLTQYFCKEVEYNLMIKNKLSIDLSRVDISANTQSLKKSIYNQAFISSCTKKEIEDILYHYLSQSMSGNSDYKKYLPLYERPLIEAGLAKYGSQLKLSDILGINRNTLRKKIYELNID
jgi:DNA-binding protein Fis